MDEKTVNAFRILGLTRKETEVYIYLSRKGSLRGRETAKGLGMHKSQVYAILKSLQFKGVVKATIESPTRFQALPIEEVIEQNVKSKLLEAAILEKTKQDLIHQLTVASLNQVYPSADSFMITEGKSKIYTKFLQMVQETQNELLLLICDLGLVKSIQTELDSSIKEKTKNDHVKLRFLIEATDENLLSINFMFKKIAETHLSRKFSIRCLNTKLGFETCFLLRDNQEILFFLSNTPIDSAADQVCLWTNSRTIVNFLRAVFNELWVNGFAISQIINRKTSQKNKLFGKRSLTIVS